MANQALVLKINESLDDPNLELPVLGCMSLDFYKKGDGTGSCSFLIGVTKETVIQIAGGELINTNGVSVGNSFTLPIGTTTLKLKATAEHGRILIRDSVNIERFGSGTVGFFKPDSTVNSPVVKVDVSQLPNNLLILDATESDNTIFTGNLARAIARMTKIAYLSIKGLESRLTGDTRKVTTPASLISFSYIVKSDRGSFKMSIDSFKPSQTIILRAGELYGNIADIKSTMVEYNVAGLTKDYTTGNIASIPSSVKTIIIQTASGLTYTSSRTWNNATSYFIILGNVVFDAESGDRILKDAANATWSTGTGLISIIGSRSSASDNAISILQTRGVSVQIANPK